MKYRILIVEDNIMLAGQQKKRLEKSGYEAEITIDEPGARKLLKKESFDLVLSDVRLPEGDGISLLEWMRKERMDIPFIIMTGYASVPDAVQAIKLGAKDYLAKPVQMDELQRQLKDIFRPKSVICDKNKDLLPRNSLQMQEVEHLVSTVAPFDISVLILGPNGAGKEIGCTAYPLYRRAEGYAVCRRELWSHTQGACTHPLFRAHKGNIYRCRRQQGRIF